MTKVVERSRLRALVCVLRGRHDWSSTHGYTINSPAYCVRCGHEGLTFLERHNWLRRWCPIQIRRGRWHLSVRLGLYWILAVRLQVAWSEHGETHPHVTVDADVWRLDLWARLGGFYEDEDGETRSLASAGARVSTYGLASKVCRIVGHDESEMFHGATYCDRCGVALAGAKEIVSA